MQANNVTAENSKENQDNTSFDLRETVDKTKEQTTNTDEDEVADILTFLSIYSVVYFPLALVLAVLSLYSLLVPFSIAISFAIFYAKR